MNRDLSAALEGPVASSTSPSSLQLALENPRLHERGSTYVAALGDAVAGKDVVGFAFAIDGALNSADVYASPRMFRVMRLKLLWAAAVEALAGSSPPSSGGQAHATLHSAGDVAEALHRAESTPGVGRAVDGRVTLVTHDTDRFVLFETPVTEEHPSPGSERWVHRSYLVK